MGVDDLLVEEHSLLVNRKKSNSVGIDFHSQEMIFAGRDIRTVVGKRKREVAASAAVDCFCRNC